MEDFNALAATLGAGIADARSCLILSSDGLVLGAHPESAEADARPARIKLASVGEPERGFLQFGTEVWCYVRRGPYAALAVAGTSVRPGLVIEQMEQVLLAAEESRSRREGVKIDASAPSAPSSKPRTALHREPRPAEEPPPLVIGAEPRMATAGAEAGNPGPAVPASPVVPASAGSGASSGDQEVAGTPPHPAVPGGPSEGREEGEDVDRFSLAREFSRLLQDDQEPADG
jgi:hypothetical protein